MILPREMIEGGPPEQYLAQFGKTGGLGCFNVAEPMLLQRGQRVVLQSFRGVEVGSILRPATLHQARLLGSQSTGVIQRPLTADDQNWLQRLETLAQELFQVGRTLVSERGLALEILDVEVLFDGQRALLQYLCADEPPLDEFVSQLGQAFGVEVRLENLALGQPHEEPAGGCGKPDCGKTEAGGCSSCSTGGCSSCGSSSVDLRPYFAHLRSQMETHQRQSLL